MIKIIVPLHHYDDKKEKWESHEVTTTFEFESGNHIYQTIEIIAYDESKETATERFLATKAGLVKDLLEFVSVLENLDCSNIPTSPLQLKP